MNKKISKILLTAVTTAIVISGTTQYTIAEKDKLENISEIDIKEIVPFLLDSNINLSDKKLSNKYENTEVVFLDINKAIDVRKNIISEISKVDEPKFDSKNEKVLENKIIKQNKQQEENKEEIKQPEENKVEEEKTEKDKIEVVESKEIREEVIESKAENNSQNNTSNTPDTSKEVQSTSTGYGNLSAEEFRLFVCIVDVEASGENFEAKLGIANAILNRLKYGWGNSIREIVYARGQFPPAHNGVLAARIQNGPWSADSERAVRSALDGNNNIGTAQSFNYYYGQTEPGKTMIIDKTFFYNFK